MTAGRKKKCRTINFDTNNMICHCFGPASLPKKDLEKLEKIFLGEDELQALIYQDITWLIMEEAAKKMGVSKTVYAGIYASAKKKVVETIISPKILMVECEKTNSLLSDDKNRRWKK